MNTQKKTSIPRWGLIALASALVILLLGGAIYAQGFGRRQADRPGPGMGRGIGMGADPGMRGPDGPGMRGLAGLGMLMGDGEIRELTAMIKTIEAINKFELTVDQVEALRDIAMEAQEMMESEFDPVRDRIVSTLEHQLDNVIEGDSSDPEAIREILNEVRESHEPGEIRDELGNFLDRAIDVLTEEQRQMMIEEAGPDPERIRERVEQWREGDRPGFFGRGQRGDGFGQRGFGRQWLDNLDEDQRERIEQAFRERMQNMREGAVRMKLMMFLLAPNSVEAMDLWLDAR